jgi:hypothetical protein
MTRVRAFFAIDLVLYVAVALLSLGAVALLFAVSPSTGEPVAAPAPVPPVTVTVTAEPVAVEGVVVEKRTDAETRCVLVVEEADGTRTPRTLHWTLCDVTEIGDSYSE